MILDQNYHHAAILKLKGDRIGRGRPDISHYSLLLALGSPLNMEHGLKCYVHTKDNHVINVEPSARLPRNSERFVSLLEQLYQETRVPVQGSALMSLREESLAMLLHSLKPDNVVALTRQGIPRKMPEVADEMARTNNPLLLVGAFSAGHFSSSTLEHVSVKYSIDSRPLEASTVVARAIYDYETAIGLERFPKKQT